jgi:enoyl-CoA hydratase
MELLLTGQTIDAKRACEVGLVNRVVPAGELMAAAMELAQTICKNGPLAVQTAKEIAVRSLNLEQGFLLERSMGARVFASDDAEGPALPRRSAHRLRVDDQEDAMLEGDG